MKTVIIVANEEEAKNLSELVFNHTPDKEVMILITGEGRTNVIKMLSEKLKNGTIKPNDRIINVGYVGAYGFKKGDIVCIHKVQHFNPSNYVKERPLELNVNSKYSLTECFTSDNFVDTDYVNPNMPDKFVCDMELYYIALMFPDVISYKIVSDELNYEDYKKASFNESWINLKEYIKENL